MIERTTYLVEAGQLPIDRTAAVATLAFVTVAALHGAPGMG